MQNNKLVLLVVENFWFGRQRKKRDRKFKKEQKTYIGHRKMVWKEELVG